MNKKILITITSILVLVIVAGGFWYVQKQERTNNEQLIRVFEERQEEQGSEKIDTSDWKTYRNDKIGYQISYPKKWKITIEDYWYGSSHFGVAITKEKKCKNSVYICKESIVTLETTPAMIRGYTSKNDKSKLLRFSSKFLNNVATNYKDFSSKKWSSCEFEIRPIYHDIGNIRFLIYSGESIRNEKNLKIRKEILKSFRLIKKLK